MNLVYWKQVDEWDKLWRAKKVTLQRAFLQSASFGYCYHVYRFRERNIDGIIIFGGLIDLVHLVCCYLIRWNHQGCETSQRKCEWLFELLIWTWKSPAFPKHIDFHEQQWFLFFPWINSPNCELFINLLLKRAYCDFSWNHMGNNQWKYFRLLPPLAK